MSVRETWLITGGAGYIGSHVAELLLENKYEIVILDSLINGLESRILFLEELFNKKIPFVRMDIRNSAAIETLLRKHNVSGVVHLAALKSVSESMEFEKEYLEVNHIATKNLVEVLRKLGIQKLVNSSTAAVYESPKDSALMSEDQNLGPISPYGVSKMLAELEVKKFLMLKENSGTSLRFFNVIGTSSIELSDKSVDNLVPIVINQIKLGERPVIFGNSYPTSDGTCLRDFVDVRDVARAHLSVMQCTNKLPLALNVGTGRGNTVLETIRVILNCLGKQEAEISIGERRSGDIAVACADVSLIKSVTGFQSHFTLEQSIKSLLVK